MMFLGGGGDRGWCYMMFLGGGGVPGGGAK